MAKVEPYYSFARLIFTMPSKASSTCSQQRKNGSRCRCTRFIRHPDQDPNRASKCRDCKHLESCHPDSESDEDDIEDTSKPVKSETSKTIDDVLRSFGGPLTKLRVKVSEADARQETNDGLTSKTKARVSTSNSKAVSASPSE